jgi:diguanylate cyclase (GGDEF)-like protein
VVILYAASALGVRVRHQAFHDSLTGLPNRLLFEDRVNQALRGEDRHSVGVLFINLDQFKRVNDSLGHTAADGLLQQVAERLLATLRSSDSAARVGGDEFAVLLPEAADEQAALDAVWRINDAMRRPFMVEQQELAATRYDVHS